MREMQNLPKIDSERSPFSKISKVSKLVAISYMNGIGKLAGNRLC